MARKYQATTKHFINVSDRYGEQVPVTIEDYQELNPEGRFSKVRQYSDYADEWLPVIVENIDGKLEVVAREKGREHEPLWEVIAKESIE